MIKGIIFDLDGTVLNTLKDLTDAINLVLNDYNKKLLNEEDTKHKVGSGFRQLMINCFENKIDEETINEAVEKFTNYYSKNYTSYTKPYDGIKSLVKWLKENNILIGINSNKKHEYTKKIVEINFPEINQELVYGKRDEYPIKPDPINNLEIISKMKLKNEEILYVGDTNIDCLTARNSNLKMVAVTWGFRSKEELKKDKPNYFVDKPIEIINLIKKINEGENDARV